MGRFFVSFHEAWAHFQAREEPLEDFFADLPKEGRVRYWLLLPGAEVRARAAEVQERLREVDGLRTLDDHFLHVTLGKDEDVRREGFTETPPLLLRHRRIGAFHPCVVSEVEGDTRLLLERLYGVAPSSHLPHLTLAITERPVPVGSVREVVSALRDTALGDDLIEEVVLCSIPVGRRAFGSPWDVVERVPLGR